MFASQVIRNQEEPRTDHDVTFQMIDRHGKENDVDGWFEICEGSYSSILLPDTIANRHITELHTKMHIGNPIKRQVTKLFSKLLGSIMERTRGIISVQAAQPFQVLGYESGIKIFCDLWPMLIRD
jgi:hypothetical protein